MRKRWYIFVIMLFAPVLAGGVGGTDGCNCFDDEDYSYSHEAEEEDEGCSGCSCSGSEADYEEPSVQVGPPTDCLTYVEEARREAGGNVVCPSCQTCAIDAVGLQQLQRDLSETRVELARWRNLAETQVEATIVASFRVLRTVTIERGRWLAQYVSDTPGATLQATKDCNGFTEPNPTVYPDQVVDICGPEGSYELLHAKREEALFLLKN